MSGSQICEDLTLRTRDSGLIANLLSRAKGGQTEAPGGRFLSSAFGGVDEVGTAIGIVRGFRQSRGQRAIRPANFRAVLQHNRRAVIDGGRNRVKRVWNLPQNLAISHVLDVFV